jgi:hypothetical protein
MMKQRLDLTLDCFFLLHEYCFHNFDQEVEKAVNVEILTKAKNTQDLQYLS